MVSSGKDRKTTSKDQGPKRGQKESLRDRLPHSGAGQRDSSTEEIEGGGTNRGRKKGRQALLSRASALSLQKGEDRKALAHKDHWGKR